VAGESWALPRPPHRRGVWVAGVALLVVVIAATFRVNRTGRGRGSLRAL